ncbi:MAG: hypothetical protein ACR2O6_14095, partial [Ilumatobacteraceae bacterium]
VGVFDGRPIGIEKQYSVGGGPKKLRGVTFAGDLGGRPIGLKIYTSDVGSIGRRRHAITTGDGRFDAAMRVDGWPEVCCIAALDPETRAMLVDTYDGRLPLVEVKHGAIRLTRTVLHDNPSRVATPEELAPFARLVQGMATRATTAYDDTAEEIRRAHGDGAAEAWAGEQAAAQGRHASGRRRGRAVVFGGFAVICIGIILAVAYSAGLI